VSNIATGLVNDLIYFVPTCFLDYRARYIWNTYYNPSNETSHRSPQKKKKSIGFFDDAFPQKSKPDIKDEFDR